MKVPDEVESVKGHLRASQDIWDAFLQRAGVGFDLTEAFPTSADAAAAEPPAPPPEPGPRRDELEQQMRDNWPEPRPQGRRRWWRRK